METREILNKSSTPVTLKQLALLLGLSHTTVSRALNDHPAISEHTKKIVRETAQQYGYIPNNAARALRNARSGAFGLVIPDIQNDFFNAVANTISIEAAKQSWQMMFIITNDKPELERNALRSLMRARVEGIIIAPTAKPMPETQKLIAQTHAVQLLRKHETIKAPVIAIDDRYGVNLSVEHLLALGHKRIGYIGSLIELSTGYERLQGFLKNFTELQQQSLNDIIYLGSPSNGFGNAAFKSIMDNPNPPTAIVLGSPRFTMGVLLAAKELKINIPNDLSLVAYGASAWTELLDIELTTVMLQEKKIAEACVKTMHTLMGEAAVTNSNENLLNMIKDKIFLPHLILGNSTKPN